MTKLNANCSDFVFRSLIGAVIISIGFYAVIWGKAKEQIVIEDALEHQTDDALESSSTEEVPLLQKLQG